MATDKQIKAAASLLGMLGAKAGAVKGGKARAAMMTRKERRALAKLAIRTRWAKQKRKPK